jgi:exodeoxyribonuclease V alpha subunit
MEDQTQPPQEEKTPTPFKVIAGVVERITYQDEETGYTVARLLPDPVRRAAEGGDSPHQASEKALVGKDHLVTIVGTLLGVVAGEALELSGFWDHHAKHGWQFSVRTYRSVLPATEQGLRRYLGSGLIKGIGPRTAEKIVAYFGLDTLDILEHHQERLREVPGLGKRRAERIATAWAEQKAIQEVMVCLQGLGVSTSLAVRIYKAYGDAATTIVKNEPYRLARDIWGIGFKTADKIALAQGYTADHPERIKAGILFALAEASENGGHTYLPRRTLAEQAAQLLGVTISLAEEAITGLMLESGIQVEALVAHPNGPATLESLHLTSEQASPLSHEPSVPSDLQGAIQTTQLASVPPGGGPTLQIARRASTPPSEEQVVYLPAFYAAEQGIARNLLRLAASPPERGRLAELQQTNFARMFDYLSTKAQFTLVERQQAGIVMALTHSVSILTGGPGTGKTTSLRALIHVLTLKKKRVILAAPTGRAAKRLAEATGISATTLHRLLQLRPGGHSPYDRANPLQADVMVVDEVSMLDTLLTNTLLKAVASGTHLLLVGDPDQLPSVGAGRVLADLIESGVVPVTQLEQIFRQRAGSSIAENARRINQGQMPLTSSGNTEFFFFAQEDTPAAADLVIDLVTRRVSTKFRFGPDEIQVLSPMHRGVCGVAELNARLQSALNPRSPHKAERHYGGTWFRVGDKVLQLRNNYEKEVFNGDAGRITAISLEDQIVTVQLDDERLITYEFNELDELTLAYAISIHKAQGSEYPVCVIPLVMEHYPLLERPLVYTGVTRARQLAILVGSKKALAIAVRNGPQRDLQPEGDILKQDTDAASVSPRDSNGRYTGLAIRLRQLGGSR